MNLEIYVVNRMLAEKCMTWRELSKESGISPVTLARINSGVQKATPKTIGRIAKGLNTTVESITGKEIQE